jgi:hypothetical protein
MLQRWKVVLPLALGLLAVLASCSPKPLDLIMRYQHAYNSHDLGQLLPLLAEDATFQMVGVFGLKGKDDIRREAEYDFALHVHMTIDKIATGGDTVWCELIEMNDWLEAAQIEEAYYSAKFVFRKGLITHIRADATPQTQEAFDRILGPLTEWASKERPEKLAEMMPQGEFLYNADNARRSLALLLEWKATVESGEKLP